MENEPAKLELVRKQPGKLKNTKDRNDRIEEAEQELYESSLSLLRDAAQFGDLDPNEELPSPSWVKAYGAKEAARRHRLCRAAWLPGKDAPTGLTIAKYVVGAFAKSRADAKRPHVLNMTLIQMPSGAQVFPEIEIVESDVK